MKAIMTAAEMQELAARIKQIRLPRYSAANPREIRSYVAGIKPRSENTDLADFAIPYSQYHDSAKSVSATLA